MPEALFLFNTQPQSSHVSHAPRCACGGPAVAAFPGRLQAACMAIITSAIHWVTGVLEFLTVRREQIQFRSGALSEDGMACVAVVSFYRPLAIGGFMFPIMATEAAGPIFVSDVIRIDLPTGFHVREEVVRINLLNGSNDGPNARIA